ncbi:hypothetical protein C0995_000397 [Termitomyces sp. Mi166|nr:hypothetical protein C0995_000397 [Termitomyces sp. Mi166\
MADSHKFPSPIHYEKEKASVLVSTKQNSSKTSVDPACERIWRKIDFFVLPVVVMFQLLSGLDRANLANARIAGLQEDLRMSDYQYTIALTITSVPFILTELPANLALRAVGPNLMLPTMLTLWGIVTTSQGFVSGYSELLACRFFLGLFEGAFSGLLAYGIVRMDGFGSRPGWAWIFILEGLFSILVGISTFFTLPRSPAHARFLNETEKDYVISQLRQTGAIGHNDDADSFSWQEVRQAFSRPQVLFLCVILFFTGAITSGLIFFTPSIVADLGYTRVDAQLYSVPPIVVAFFGSMISANVSDRFGARGLVIMFSALLKIVGFVVFLVSSSLHVKYGSLFLIVAGSHSAAPALLTWNANNTSPHTRRATAIAVGSIMTNTGGVLSTWLLGTLSSAPFYKKANITFLIFSILIFVMSGINIVYLSSQNRKKAMIRATTRRENEKPGLGDHSAWFIYNL